MVGYEEYEKTITDIITRKGKIWKLELRRDLVRELNISEKTAWNYIQRVIKNGKVLQWNGGGQKQWLFTDPTRLQQEKNADTIIGELTAFYFKNFEDLSKRFKELSAKEQSKVLGSFLGLLSAFENRIALYEMIWNHENISDYRKFVEDLRITARNMLALEDRSKMAELFGYFDRDCSNEVSKKWKNLNIQLYGTADRVEKIQKL